MVVGLRSFPDGFAYVILDGTQTSPSVIAKGRLSVPKNDTWPACLSWVRKQIGEILEPYGVKSACIRTTEPMAKKKSAGRFQIEAILQEYLHCERSIDCATRIGSQLKRDIRDFTDAARYLERVLTRSHILAELNTPRYKDAALAAVAELPEE
jgi:hypothetical protein